MHSGWRAPWRRQQRWTRTSCDSGGERFCEDQRGNVETAQLRAAVARHVAAHEWYCQRPSGHGCSLTPLLAVHLASFGVRCAPTEALMTAGAARSGGRVWEEGTILAAHRKLQKPVPRANSRGVFLAIAAAKVFSTSVQSWCVRLDSSRCSSEDLAQHDGGACMVALVGGLDRFKAVAFSVSVCDVACFVVCEEARSAEMCALSNVARGILSLPLVVTLDS